MHKAGPKRKQQYGDELKAAAVQFSSLPDARIKGMTDLQQRATTLSAGMLLPQL